MTDSTILPFAYPSVRAKKVTADFDGGRLTSDGGVMLLSMAERRLGIADRLACVQARLRKIAGQRQRSLFAADALAIGERAFAERCDPPHLHTRRSIDGVL